jgi:hypothetical protein
MLPSPRSTEDESVTCTPTPYSLPISRSSRSTFPASTSYPPVTTPAISNTISSSKRSGPSDLAANYKRVKIEYNTTPPNPTSNPHHSQPVIVPTTSPNNIPVSIGQRSVVSPLQSLGSCSEVDAQIEIEPMEPYDISPALAKAISDGQEALLAIRDDASGPDGPVVQRYLSAAIETVRACCGRHVWASSLERPRASGNGEPSSILRTPATIHENAPRISSSGTSTSPPFDILADTIAKDFDESDVTSLIDSSRIGPLRNLVNLRLKQESAIEEKDLEIATLLRDKEGLKSELSRLKLESRKTNEDWKGEVQALTTMREELLRRCAKMELEARRNIGGKGQLQEERITGESPIPTPPRSLASRLGPDPATSYDTLARKSTALADRISKDQGPKTLKTPPRGPRLAYHTDRWSQKRPRSGERKENVNHQAAGTPRRLQESEMLSPTRQQQGKSRQNELDSSDRNQIPTSTQCQLRPPISQEQATSTERPTASVSPRPIARPILEWNLNSPNPPGRESNEPAITHPRAEDLRLGLENLCERRPGQSASPVSWREDGIETGEIDEAARARMRTWNALYSEIEKR